MCPVNTPLTSGRHDCSIHFHFCLQGDCTLHPNSLCLCLFQAKKKIFIVSELTRLWGCRHFASSSNVCSLCVGIPITV